LGFGLLRWCTRWRAQRACLAVMCWGQGSRPSPPSLGEPMWSADGTPPLFLPFPVLPLSTVAVTRRWTRCLVCSGRLLNSA